MLKILRPEPSRSKTAQLKRKVSERPSLSKKRGGGCIFNGGRLVSIVLALTLMVGQVFVLGEIPAFALDESCARELKEMGMIHGDQSGNLNTDQYMTRLEMSVLLSRIYGESDAATEYSGASDYKDASKIAEWGRKYADFAKKTAGWSEMTMEILIRTV